MYQGPKCVIFFLAAVLTACFFVPSPTMAQSKAETFTLTYNAGPGGYLQGAAHQEVPSGGEGSTITAVAVPGYRFMQWSDGVSLPVRRDTGVMEDLVVNALFDLGAGEETTAATVLYVKPGGTGDGSSWSQAGELQAMVNQAGEGAEIWVAAGIYTGLSSPLLAMKPGVALYGGFAGMESLRGQRDWRSNVSELDGEGIRRCVVGANNALLDGFVLSNGYADYGGGLYNYAVAPAVANCTFRNHHAIDDGGAVYNGSASPIFINCVFTGNASSSDGGGMYNINASPLLTNCVFTGNSAQNGHGGGVFCNLQTPMMTHCTFYGNKAQGKGWGLFNINASPVVTNCVFAMNELLAENKSTIEGGASNITYSCIQGEVYPGEGNTDADPLFVDAAAGDLRLRTDSPCVDAAVALGAAGTDILDIVRPQGEGPDMGAYELDITPPAVTLDQANDQEDPTNVSPILFTVGFDEPVTGFKTGDVSLSGTASASTGIITGSGAFYTVAVSGMVNPGTVIANIVAGVCRDRAGNGNTASTSVDNEVVYGSHTLTYTAGENGTVQGDSPQTVFYSHDGAAVTAEPAEGYHFMAWSDGRTDNPRTDVNVTGDITVTANFAINVYTLTYTAGGHGTIAGATPQAVNHGSDGTPVTAEPAVGYHFTDWSDGRTDNPRIDVSVTSDLAVTANFAINVYTLTYSAEANGAVDGASPQSVTHGSDGTPVTAMPAEGHHFVDWSDGRTDNPRTDTGVTGDVAVTANFFINIYTLTYTAGENGSITGATPQSVTHGSAGEAVTAAPAEGYHFVDWSDGRTDNPRTEVNVTGDAAVTANFAINVYTLTYSAGEHGTVAGTSPQSVAHGGNGETVTAVPEEGYHFVDWSDGRTDNPRTEVNVTGDAAVTANFAINVYTLTYTAAENGSITGATPQSVMHGNAGEAVTAVPAEGYHFVDWSDGRIDNPRTEVNVTGDVSVAATFAINVYTLTYAAGENGTIEGATVQNVEDGTSGTSITAVPAEGYHFIDWSDGRTDNPRIDTDAGGNVTVTANFAINTYTLTYVPGENGRIVGENSQTVNHGGDGVSVTAVPDPGYRFEGWSDGVTTATRHDTNIIEGLTVNAIFAPKPVEEKIPVPDVLLSTSEDAEDFITSAGLALGTVTGECSDEVPEGAVISQEPAAGTMVSSSMQVNLVISTGSCSSSCESFKWFGWDDVLLGGLALLALALISMFVFGGSPAVLK